MLSKIYSQMTETAAEFRRQFDVAFAQYVEAEPGADARLIAGLKVLEGKTKEVILPLGFSDAADVVDGEHHGYLQVAFESFAVETGAKYNAGAPSSSTPGSDGTAHHHCGSLIFDSIGGLTKGIDILTTNGVDILMSGGSDTLTPFRIVDRITEPESTGHRFVLVSVMDLNTGGLVADAELHLADIAKIRPEHQRNEAKFHAMKRPLHSGQPPKLERMPKSLGARATRGSDRVIKIANATCGGRSRET